jgi:hypothetical protein
LGYNLVLTTLLELQLKIELLSEPDAKQALITEAMTTMDLSR